MRNSALLLGLSFFLLAVVFFLKLGCRRSAPQKTPLPADWSESARRHDSSLRAGSDMSFRSPDVGERFRFAPKPLADSTLPSNPHRRKLIREGRALLANTAEKIPQYVGNDLSCASCHGGGGSPVATGIVGQDISMLPLVGTAAGLPEWTNRTHRMRDLRQRILGCFLRSMNGGPNAPAGTLPAYDSELIQAMEAYIVWLNKGVPSQVVPYWRNLKHPPDEKKVPIPKINPVRGAKLYLEQCARCHGLGGQGRANLYPPLWGPNSYNDGAGMGRIYTAAAFIRESMPYQNAHTLANWRDVQDLAGFVNGHDRPSLARKPKDYPKTAPPDEAVYYKRVQQRFGYDQNPMAKKLTLAGLPTDTSALKSEAIPDSLARYGRPLRDSE